MKTKVVKIGNIKIGGGNEIAIQSMCSTKTENITETVRQIKELEREGCAIVRVAVPNKEAAEALLEIKKRINIPLVSDIHFDHTLALKSIENGADKIRINPGNIGGEEKVREILKAAKNRGVPIRIGVNGGSVEQDLIEKYGYPSAEAITESAFRWVRFFEKNNFREIVISVKSSDVREMIGAYEMISAKTDYPLHLGLTEAGTLIPGTVKSSISMGALLQKGIGDTIRVSLTEDPVVEVKVAKEILKSLGLYRREPEIISCPTCGRTEIDMKKLVSEIEKRASSLKKCMKIAILGCPVNGIGEAKEADFAIAGGRKQGIIFRKGHAVKTVPENKLIDELFKLIESE